MPTRTEEQLAGHMANPSRRLRPCGRADDLVVIALLIGSGWDSIGLFSHFTPATFTPRADFLPPALFHSRRQPVPHWN
jgi:hypothetical protein